MVVEFQKLHSNYLQSKYNSGMKSGRRINKLHPIENFGAVSADMTDMCVMNNKKFEKTILTSTSNGLLSFKGRGLSEKTVSKIYDGMKNVLNPKLSKRAAKELQRTEKAIQRLALEAEKKHPLLTKIFKNEKFQKAMKFMNDNQLLSDAAIALMYTCFMRPLSISALPTKDKNEKEKNIYQIGHSISTGIIGFITTFALQTPIKHAIDKVTSAVTSKNAQKYISKNSEYLFKKANIEKIKLLMERSHQPVTIPLRAALTIYLVPKVLKLFGLTKNVKNKNAEAQGALPYDAFKYFASFKRKNSSFQNFSGGLSNAGK